MNPTTGYNLSDRLKELSSYSGIAVVLLGTVLPQLVTPVTMIAVLTPAAAIIGSLLFFLPENRAVITAEQVMGAVMQMLPAGYRVPVPPLPAQAEAQPQGAPGGGVKAAVVVMMALGLTLGLAACGAQTTAGTQSPATGWSDVVKYAKSADAALDTVAIALKADPAINPVQLAQIQMAVSGLDSLVAMLDGTGAPLNAKQLAMSVLNGIDDVVQVIPVVPPEIQLAVGIGTPMLTAFISGLPAPAN
jgi:hypothetical protein